MKQLLLAYQEPITESLITHTVTQKKSRYKLSKLGEQRLYSLILLLISIVVPVLTVKCGKPTPLGVGWIAI